MILYIQISKAQENKAMKVYYIIEAITEKDSRLASEPFTKYSDASAALENRVKNNASYNGAITSRVI